ncbi:MAG: glycosyltransferase family 2 protein [Clostridia bacterium]|nr:glycosyltransferase family 2 protein [Clostridia bacterium]
MIFFGIPLRSKAVSNDWEKVSLFFNRTLWSVYNQTDPDFKIFVACHDIPELNHEFDERVEFIKVDSPVPHTREEMMLDKGHKVHTIGMKIREYGGGFTMMVDADDIQSCRIAEYVNKHSDADGFVSRNGYYYHIGDNYIKKGHKFPNGSSTIVKYSVDDLPDKYYDTMVASENSNPHIIRKKHGDIPKICAEMGRPLKPLPFIASIYVRETGDNHSLMNKNESKFRVLEQKIMPKIYINDKLRKEFSIDWM